MRTKRWTALLTTLMLLVLLQKMSAAEGDPHSGTWKMNPTKSTYSPREAPKSATLKIDSDGDNIKFSADEVDAAGRMTHIRYTAKFDSDDYHITGVPYADTITFVPIVDPNKMTAMLQKAGQVIMIVTWTVSKDGKTLTTTFMGKDEHMREVHDVIVYDKQ